ncbi:MAG TPA: hypothetical protein VMW27_21545 [Thermoanaerobaculia bacterium]|nr:hypothetical protein [Thermoanaerobaculia bacterium]
MTDPTLQTPPGPHPTPEQLYRARRGPRDAEAERHLAHAAVCAVCSEELLHMDAFDNPEPLSQERLDAAWDRFGQAPAPQRRRPPFLLVAYAAAALLAVSIGLGLWKAAQPPIDDGLRGGEATQAAVFRPVGTLAEPPREIVFPRQGSAPLQVTVFDAERSYTWTSPAVTDGRVEIPEGERRKLQPGVQYYWTVLGEDVPAQAFSLGAR